ncbi:unnamed protein product, partial [marine sediment metagenome]
IGQDVSLSVDHRAATFSLGGVFPPEEPVNF